LLISASALSNNPDTSLSRVLHVIQAIGRRSAYFALLVENPLAISQLVKLCSASDWISRWIGQHPMLLDELLAPANLYTPIHKQDLQRGLSAMIGDGTDLETVMNHVREFKNSTLLRIAAADIGPGMAPDLVGQKLTMLAETILQQAYKTAQLATVEQFGTPFCSIAGKHTAPGFIVVAYGKFGGAELGYTSDLDIIFLHSGCEGESGTGGERNVALEMFYARLVQRLINFLTARTTAGSLYEIDTRLRPSGRSGLLVTTMDSFCQYQHKKAWTWEHQALIRARPVLGDADLQQAFWQCRQQVLCQPREPAGLKQEIRDMRGKMMAQQSSLADEQFDIKLGRGGIVDIEFMVQYWVLQWAAEHPPLIENTDNIGILEHLAESRLLDRDRAQFLIDAYRQLLSAEHHAKLLDGSSQIRRQVMASVIEGVASIWQEVME
jgi:glutamate-ammonia-ligase adenylyltransferase